MSTSLGGFQLLDETTFQAYNVATSQDEYGDITETRTNFTLRNAWLEPLSGYEQKTLPDGYKDKHVMKLFTSTKVRSAQEGTNLRADVVEVVWDDDTFDAEVVMVRPWKNGHFLNHYQALIVKSNER